MLVESNYKISITKAVNNNQTPHMLFTSKSSCCQQYQKETFHSILRYEKKTCDYKSHISILYFL
jgi:hypothetical protein